MNQGYTVHSITSPAGASVLAVQRLNAKELNQAIDLYAKAEDAKIGTIIGITDDGVFYSKEENWNPDRPNAFVQPIGNIPWIYILELLGYASKGSMEKFMSKNGGWGKQNQSGGGHKRL